MSKKQRAMWLILAVLFIGTALASGGWAIWQSRQDSKNQANQNNTNQTKENKLAGTQLPNFTPIEKIDKLQTIDTTLGTGAEAKADSTVTVHYTGALASSGVIFESSIDNGGQPVSFPLSSVIKGWQEGIPGMKVGGTRRLLIPAALAYGDQGNSKIPANSDLVFDVTLLAVK